MLNIKKINSVRKYNKIRHKIFLCKDDFGKKLYAGDYVELNVSIETNTSWISRIWWTEIDGAYVESHPAHIKMGLGTGTRELRYFLQKKYDVPIHNWEDDTISEVKPSHSMKKVSYTEYIKWKEMQSKKR